MRAALGYLRIGVLGNHFYLTIARSTERSHQKEDVEKKGMPLILIWGRSLLKFR
jgi:hypothetical protein